jgi:hypothetical protein
LSIDETDAPAARILAELPVAPDIVQGLIAIILFVPADVPILTLLKFVLLVLIEVELVKVPKFSVKIGLVNIPCPHPTFITKKAKRNKQIGFLKMYIFFISNNFLNIITQIYRS